MSLRSPAHYASSVGFLLRSYPLKNHLPCLLPLLILPQSVRMCGSRARLKCFLIWIKFYRFRKPWCQDLTMEYLSIHENEPKCNSKRNRNSFFFHLFFDDFVRKVA